MKHRKPIKTRTGTRKESEPFNDEITKWSPGDTGCALLEDGNHDAVRVIFNAETGEVLRRVDGSPQYCAPWLSSATFSY